VDQATFYRLAQEVARGVRLANSNAAADDARLADAKRKLELVSTVSAVGVVTLREIAALAEELLRRAGDDSRTGRAMSPRSKSRLG
jgi:hypothetical protein